MTTMYSGIIQTTQPVVSIDEQDQLRRIGIQFSAAALQGLILGASVSVDGVCLTVAAIEKEIVFMDVMIETLRKTTLGELTIGQKVNIERSLKMGDEIGGHQMAGHVYGTATISEKRDEGKTVIMTFHVPVEWMKYIVEKGFIAVNGVSLTVSYANNTAGTFQVYFIPETIARTSFAHKQVGDRVNIEIDHMTQVMVETVERIMKQQ